MKYRPIRGADTLFVALNDRGRRNYLRTPSDVVCSAIALDRHAKRHSPSYGNAVAGRRDSDIDVATPLNCNNSRRYHDKQDWQHDQCYYREPILSSYHFGNPSICYPRSSYLKHAIAIATASGRHLEMPLDCNSLEGSLLDH